MAQTMNGEELNALFEELFVQCETANKLSDKLCSKLEKLSETERQQLVSRMNKDATPLFIAAKRGVLDIVRYLLAKCKADVNHFCECYGESEPEMTALMKAQNVDVARCLLEHGARYKSTALRLHIRSLRLEVADFLFSQGANINDELAVEGITCLEYVNDDPQMYELFLKYGANVNAYNEDQKTPLHTAIEENNLWKVEQLLKYGADPKLKNSMGEDALQLTCDYIHEDIFNYLMEHVKYSDANRANAHELMGAEYVNYEIPYSNPMAIKHWTAALKIRLNNGGPFLERESRNEPLINDVKEFRTMDDLQRIENCPRSFFLQVTLINCRILEYNNAFDDLYYAYRAFNKNSKFEDALYFIMRVIRDILETEDVVDMDNRKAALQAAVVILNIVDNNGIVHMDIHFDDILTTVDILWAQLVDPMVDEDVQIIIMPLLHVLLKMSKSGAQLKRLKTLVTQMIQNSNEKGRCILHMVASIKGALTIRCMKYLNNVPKRKYWDMDPLPVIQLLLKRGYHVDALDLFGLSPQHLSANKECAVDLVNCLLEHEAHIDRINAVGIRRCHLVDAVPDCKTFKYVTLECLAARIIVDHKVPYKHLNFPALDTFIEMH